jgi:hypothetical protein
LLSSSKTRSTETIGKTAVCRARTEVETVVGKSR